MMVLSFAACSSKESEEPESNSPEIDWGTPHEIEEYYGIWECGRASITIDGSVDEDTEDGNDFLLVKIHWGNTYADAEQWVYECTFDQVSLVDDGRGTEYNIVFSDVEGEPETVTVVAEDLAASFTINDDGTLTWKDFRNDVADGMRFVKVSE